MLKKLIALSLIAGVVSAHAEDTLRSLGVLPSNKPAFLQIEKLRPSEDPSLLISSFQPFGRDEVRHIANIGSFVSNVSLAAEQTLATTITWPNGMHTVPESISGGAPLIAVAGGFLVPGKGTGAITLLDRDTKSTRKLTRDKSGWFYHRIAWFDVDNDGRLDILTARGNKPLFGSAKGELLWLKQPSSNPLTATWTEHVLKSGPDVHFVIDDLNGDGTPEIVATEFFAKKLSLHWFEGGVLKSRVLDSSLGAAFDVSIEDLNNDGRRDLLVTNHENQAAKAAVFAYEVPQEVKTGTFIRHTLLTNIQTRNSGAGQASPGTAFAFHPQVSNANGKPQIMVSGDGSQRVHWLAPTSTSSSDWNYQERIVVDVGGTVGQLAIADVNGDGYVEVFVPAYDANKIYAFTFAPAL
ncbi:VCBS repeat-containing protein [Permianibacter sp. IMCC34836]|uniref:FG-GAP repeat domain-containing protein n=1 Tax=Permianibacter fluminis TaxID=2738515 RepID=UPI001555A058|nr:VCBS repeat-containing protein [Permianibacter fluminis]NQD36609.1 VCBS repeat-containing protein [Permianibacter fluminis]